MQFFHETQSNAFNENSNSSVEACVFFYFIHMNEYMDMDMDNEWCGMFATFREKKALQLQNRNAQRKNKKQSVEILLFKNPYIYNELLKFLILTQRWFL